MSQSLGIVMDSRREKGRLGEHLAREFLREKGLIILESNVRCPLGEIDVVARDGSTLVFVEVRSRSVDRFGLPQESVNRRKQRRITQLAQWYLKKHPFPGLCVRFDVVAVSWEREPPRITWIPNAFEACE